MCTQYPSRTRRAARNDRMRGGRAQRQCRFRQRPDARAAARLPRSARRVTASKVTRSGTQVSPAENGVARSTTFAMPICCSSVRLSSMCQLSGLRAAAPVSARPRRDARAGETLLGRQIIAASRAPLRPTSELRPLAIPCPRRLERHQATSCGSTSTSAVSGPSGGCAGAGAHDLPPATTRAVCALPGVWRPCATPCSRCATRSVAPCPAPLSPGV